MNDIVQDLDYSFELVTAIKRIKERASINRPYSINVIESIGTDENANSSILASFLRQHDEKDNYDVLKHFVLTAFGESFPHKILHPVIHTEEVVTDDKRIDILVYEEGIYAIIIENKIWDAPEQNHQLANYIEGMNERGFSNEQIYIIYLPQTDVGGPTSVSWKNRHKYSYEEEFSSRYCKMSFRDGIIGWLQQEDFPKVDTPFFEPSRQLYIDYLKGVFKLRDTDNMEQTEIYEYLKEKLGLDGRNIHDATIVARKAEELAKCLDYLKKMKVGYMKDIFREWRDQLMKDFPEYEDLVIYEESPSMYLVGIAVPFNENESAIQLVIEYSAQWLGAGLKYNKKYSQLKTEMQEYVSSHGLSRGMVKGTNYLYYTTKQFDECFGVLKQMIKQWKEISL